jgi:CRP-like cAMP-binding protein
MFKYGEAKAWKAAVEELNEEADALLKEVAAAINEIGDGCEGVMVESLVDVARGLTNRFTELVNSLGKLVAALGEVIMNFLNMISQRAQQKSSQIWSQRPLTLPEKIVEFLSVRVDNPNGQKILQIKMEDLASIIGETRINVSRTLNSFRERGIIELRRKEIIIPSFRKFIEATNEPATP